MGSCPGDGSARRCVHARQPAGRGTSAPAVAAGEVLRSGPPKRMTAAIQSDPGSLNAHVNPPGSGVPGLDVVETLVSAGLSIADSQSRLVPLLAENVPTIENGLRKVTPDGRMETTWRIRPNAQWQDGTPFTAGDLLFTAQVEQDKAIDTLPKPAYDSVESITARTRTIIVTWKRPFIGADQLFNTPPLPRHILEKPYLEDKATFGQLPYWTQEMMSTGAYRVRHFVGGSHVLLEASDRYVLGRPKVDEIEVKFIPDGNTLAANILAGAVDVTLGRSLSLDEAVQVRDRWQDGKMDLAFAGWLVVFPQFMNPNPAVVANAQFLRALLHAVDRGQMAETLMSGTVPVAHTFLSPSDPAYADIQPEIVRYEHDTRRAGELLEGLGYVRGGDGQYRDAAGQRLAVEIRVSSGRDLNMKTIFAVADYWQRLGIAAEPLVMPQQRARDREYVQTFPSFILYNQPNDINSLNRHLSSQTPLPDNNYVGNNNSRYASPEFDSLIERFFATIPTAERTRVLGQVIHHMTENLSMMGQFYNAEPALIANRLVNVVGRKGGDAFPTWNVQDWDVR